MKIKEKKENGKGLGMDGRTDQRTNERKNEWMNE